MKAISVKEWKELGGGTGDPGTGYVVLSVETPGGELAVAAADILGEVTGGLLFDDVEIGRTWLRAHGPIARAGQGNPALWGAVVGNCIRGGVDPFK